MKKIHNCTLTKRIVSTVLVTATAISCLSVQAFAEERKTPSGIAFDSIEQEIESLQEDKNYASFATSVFCGDEILYTGQFGYADKENNLLADDYTVYEWGSVSKTMVWVSALQLYEQGKLDLEADIREYLPDGFFKKLKYDDPITMLDLMNHTGGWQETQYTVQVNDEYQIIPLGEALRYSEPPQVFRPGEVVGYSNWGAALGGYIIECVSGVDYTEYLHKNILEPLGMEHTAVAPDHRDNEWVREQREKLKSYRIFGDYEQSVGTAMTYINLYPAGGVTGTIQDMAKYAQSFVSDNCPLFEKQETLDLLLSGSSFYGLSNFPNSCHGFFFSQYAVNVIGHSGATDACSSVLLFDPESRVGVVVMANQYGESNFCGGIPHLLFGDFKDNPSKQAGEISIRNDISGTYVSTRSYFKGMFKIMSALNMTPLSQISEDTYGVAGYYTINRIGNDLYCDDVGFAGSTVTSDGRTVLQGFSLIESRDVYLKMAMVIIYVAIIAISLILLIIKLIKKIIKRGNPYSGSKLVATAQIARIVSGVVAFVMIDIQTSNMGISKALGTVFAIIQLLCMLVFAVTAVISVISMFSQRDDKAKPRIYIFSALSNVYSVIFILTFELICFWL